MRPLEQTPSQLNDRVRWFLDNPNIQVFISFTVKITTPYLKKIRYSPYQQVLWKIIRDKHNTGMGYRRISDWLNEHSWKSNYVYSGLKRFKERQQRIKFRNKHYKPIFSKMWEEYEN